MKEERLKKEKQDMLGFYDYTVVLTYISLAVSVFGMTRALEGDFKVAILCLALSGLCDMFDGKIQILLLTRILTSPAELEI